MKKFLSVVRQVSVVVAISLLAGGLYLLVDAWSALGKAASGERLATMEASANYKGSGFANPIPQKDYEMVPMMIRWFSANPAIVEPTGALPLQERKRADYAANEANALRVTWLGHSTTLIEIDGKRILTDPVWSERASPFTELGPHRFHAPPLHQDQLPNLDAVLISHDHYDHLDEATIRFLKRKKVQFLVPLGIGAHLEYWGVDPQNITELDWWEETTIGGVRIVCTPSRHFSGRKAIDNNATLWSSWTVLGKNQRVFFSGDSAMTPQFKKIGDKYGPFDITMMEAGAYNEMWADVHLGPEQAVQAHQDLRGKVLMPIHWGTFNLALHSWTEPVERLRVAAKAAGVTMVSPEPGEIIDVSNPAPIKTWWPTIPWETAEQHPVVSSGL